MPTPNSVTPQEVQQFLIANGLSPVSAAGLVGNFIVESGNFDPRVIFGQRRGDQGTAYGIGQWRGDRRQNLFKFAELSGFDVNDWKAQVLFMLEESNPQSPFRDAGAVRARRQANAAKNVRESVGAWLGAERPAGWTSQNPYGAHSFNQRLEQAQITLAGKNSQARARAGAYVNPDGTVATGRDTRFDQPVNQKSSPLTPAQSYARTRTNPLDYGQRPLQGRTENPFGLNTFDSQVTNYPQNLTPADASYNPFLDNPFNPNRRT